MSRILKYIPSFITIFPHPVGSQARSLSVAIESSVSLGWKSIRGLGRVQNLMQSFVVHCALLVLRQMRNDIGVFVNRPFSCCVKLSEALSSQSKHSYHREALQSADVLKTTIEKAAARIYVITSSPDQ